MSEVWAVVCIEYEDTWRWFGKRHGVITFTRSGCEAELAGAKQCIVLDDLSTDIDKEIGYIPESG